MPLLKIDDLKPIGAFIENTVRPIISELKEAGVLQIEIDGLNKTLTKLVISHTISTIFYCLRDIIVIAIIGYIVWKTSL